MAFELPPLPYAYDALQPYMSEETLKLHHDKHHQLYVTTLNKLTEGNELSGKSLEEVVKVAGGDLGKYQPVMNQAGQHLNHTIFWETMKPGGASAPTGELASMIDQAFGSFDEFKEKFKSTSATVFGSGWGWLVLDGGKLDIIKTPNGDNPLGFGKTPLLGVDMWEHAFYVDYRNVKADYLTNFVNHLVNWDVVAENLKKAA
ncbi:superoxide dismutase [Marinivivus vitaminiproducens]|uniref:superoxide dismutase n=1 Tax=Marinivivus vitaminiproducens TaxID=3035935 RepID=UPI00279B8D44|nr:superoxide dismutase [Geminicoccaceae bacterium SCSIO 64248]